MPVPLEPEAEELAGDVAVDDELDAEVVAGGAKKTGSKSFPHGIKSVNLLPDASTLNA